MRYGRTIFACGIGALLLTCTSCSVEELDTNGDGFITKSELLSAAFDSVCGDADQADEPDDETPTDETPVDETPADEIPNGGTNGNENAGVGP
jgi:hypothetical protein